MPRIDYRSTYYRATRCEVKMKIDENRGLKKKGSHRSTYLRLSYDFLFLHNKRNKIDEELRFDEETDIIINRRSKNKKITGTIMK